MPRQFSAGAFFAFGGLIIAYIFATVWADYQLPWTVGYLDFPETLFGLRGSNENLFTQLWLIFLFLGMAGFALGAHSASEKLTDEGTSSWQTRREMKQHKFLGTPGKGFVLAKTTNPGRKGEYVTTEVNGYTNCLVVAPTGAGKGVGFVYPNLLTFEGSTITLDVKGENYETTARRRAKMGNKVFKFAPVQFGENSHRYNPLERIGKLESYSQISYELRKIATLFLQADGAGEWLKGAIQLFTVAGCVAQEQNDFTLGGIYKVLSSGDGNIQKHIGDLAKTAKNAALARELSALAKLETKTLSSYMSVMNNAGFDLWSNPHICAMTAKSDFSFSNLRREKTSIYFVVSESDLEPMAGLVRLFFNELVATMQAAKPGKDEPHEFMIILDEFHLLGKMEKVANAMTLIRGYGGRIAIITQTIPKLDAIYDKEERHSIQGGAGLKLYMTPSEEITIEDLSNACGTTTKRTITKSRRSGLGEKTTITEKTEERPLLTPNDARQLPDDVAIIVAKGKQPLYVKAIKHYDDPTFKKILAQDTLTDWNEINEPLEKARRLRNEQQIEALMNVRGLGQVVVSKERPPKKNKKGQTIIQQQDDEPNVTEDAIDTSAEAVTPAVAQSARTTEDLAKLKDTAEASLDLNDDVNTLPSETAVDAIRPIMVVQRTKPKTKKIDPIQFKFDLPDQSGSDQSDAE